MLKLILIYSFIFFYLTIESKSLECGEVKIYDANSLIAGGKPAKTGQWPWLVSLFGYIKSEDEYKYFCGATLINEKALVTAAHCLYDFPASTIQAFLGKFNLTIEDEENSVMRLISEKKVHKDYIHGSNWKKSLADIAILIMETPVEFTDYIQPICLPSGNENVFDIHGTVVGYGKSGPSSPIRDVPYLVHMTSIQLLTCSLSHRKSTTILSEKSFCAKGHDGTPCNGDSGGGFYRFINRKWTLLGIVSHGINFLCDPNDFVTFVNVPLFVEWINENAEKIVTVGGEIRVEYGCDGFTCKDYHRFYINSSEVPNSPNYWLKSILNNEVDWFEFKDQKSMKYLPLNTFEVFPNIEFMNGGHSGIVKIFKSNFKNCKKLKRIRLYRNEIEEIEAGSFDDATELEELDLSFNKISSLDPKLFHNTKKLKKLYLNDNELTSLSVDAFIYLTELEVLDLSENEISNLHPELFHTTKKLKILYLDNNELTSLSVDAFIYLTELEVIYLFNNPGSSSINANKTLYLRMNKKLWTIYINKSPYD